MSNSVSGKGGAGGTGWERAGAGLYGTDGRRKYLNRAERQRAMAAMEELDADRALFALTLAWTGARISEVLALTPASFQRDHGVVSIVTLKRRRFVMREVPVPPDLMRMLDARFDLAAAQRDAVRGVNRLWPWSRVTGWRIIKKVMNRAGIAGRHACPKAFRHAFGIGTLHARIPINLTQRWLGHARISTTAIYAAACGPEEHAFAALFWDDRIGRECRAACGDFEAAAIVPGAVAHHGAAPPTATRPHAAPSL